MPLLRQSLYAQNINLYLAPTADARDAWLSLMRTASVEGRCFVLSSNMCVRDTENQEDDNNLVVKGGKRFSREEDEMEITLPRESIFDQDGNEIVLSCPDNENRTSTQTNSNSVVTKDKPASKASWSCRGGSCIVDPFGDVLAGPQWEDDHGIIFADVDFRDCIKGRLDLDAGGSYSRNDSFKLAIDGLDLEPLPY